MTKQHSRGRRPEPELLAAGACAEIRWALTRPHTLLPLHKRRSLTDLERHQVAALAAQVPTGRAHPDRLVDVRRARQLFDTAVTLLTA